MLMQFPNLTELCDGAADDADVRGDRRPDAAGLAMAHRTPPQFGALDLRHDLVEAVRPRVA